MRLYPPAIEDRAERTREGLYTVLVEEDGKQWEVAVLEKKGSRLLCINTLALGVLDCVLIDKSVIPKYPESEDFSILDELDKKILTDGRGLGRDLRRRCREISEDQIV